MSALRGLSGRRFGVSNNNSILNSAMSGAAAPNTPPSNWGVFWGGGLGVATDGVTLTITGTGQENGISYIDVRVAGTPTATNTNYIRTTGNTTVPAANGQTWRLSAWLKFVSGTSSVVSLFVGERDAAGANLANTTTAQTITSTLTQYSLSRTNTNALTTYELGAIGIGYTLSVAIDFTLRIGFPQLNQQWWI